MTKQDLLFSYFFNRYDVAAALKTGIDWKTKEKKSHPIPINITPDELKRLLAYHVTGPSIKTIPPPIRYSKKNGATGICEADEHLRIGSYLISKDSTTKIICIDLDGGGAKTTELAKATHSPSTTLTNPTAAVISAWYRAEEMGLTSYIERSGGGAGWHLWLMFSDFITANDARRIGLAIVEDIDAELINGEKADARQNKGVEIFPKQSKVKNVGSLVFLPFWHNATKPDGNTFFKICGAQLAPYAVECAEFCVNDSSSDNISRLLSFAPPERRSDDDQENTTDVNADDPRQQQSSLFLRDPDAERSSISSALSAIDPDMDYHSWLSVGMALHSSDPSSASLSLWNSWSARGAKYKSGEPAEKWSSFATSNVANPVHLGSLFALAKKTGWVDPNAHAAPPEMTDAEFAEFVGDAPLEIGGKKKEGKGGKEGKAGKEKESEKAEPKTKTKTKPISKPKPKLPHSTLPIIKTNGRNLRDLIFDAWAAYFLLAERTDAATHLYQHNGEIVRLILSPDNGSPFIKIVSEPELLNLMAHWATWAKIGESEGSEGGGGEIPGSPPLDVVRAVRAIPHDNLPRVEEIVTVPFFDEQMELIATPGYHASSRVFLFGDEKTLPQIPEIPTEDDVFKSASLLFDDLLFDFPFATQADLCHAICMFILPFYRRAINGPTPIHLVEAPAAGSGKSLLADLGQLIFSGIASSTTIGKDEEETRKKITALLERGDRVVVIDNVRGGIDSSQLASLLTKTISTDRVLGATQMVSSKNNAVWIFTGNNPDLSGELARRAVRVRIDTETERPFERSGFKHNPIRRWVLDNRLELIRSMLILVQNWKAHGSIHSSIPFGSFEDWVEITGGIMNSAGIPGFLENQNELYEQNDAKSSEERAFVKLWSEKFHMDQLSSEQLVEFCRENNILSELFGDENKRAQIVRMSKMLRRLRDTTYAKWKIVSRRDSHFRHLLWHLEPAHLHDVEKQRMLRMSCVCTETGNIPATNSLKNNDSAYVAYVKEPTLACIENNLSSVNSSKDHPAAVHTQTYATCADLKRVSEEDLKIDLAKIDNND